MCGIGGLLHKEGHALETARHSVQVMNRLLAHRGPDGEGTWVAASGNVAFAHRRLSIIDIATGAQPMSDGAGNTITYNGEIYNYIELRNELGRQSFRTTSDTEVILAAYRKWGLDCVAHLRGMFAFAIWDEREQRLFCARDRFGIKPLYFSQVGATFLFASEVKALMPFLPDVATDVEALKDYLAFQFCMGGKTLFNGVRELQAGHSLTISNGATTIRRYWEVYYNIDFDHTAAYFEEQLAELVQDSVTLHLRSDVPVGAYVSGGLDSGVVASLAAKYTDGMMGFTGKFAMGPEYDESHYARAVAEHSHFPIHELEITSADFIANIRKVIYHLDYPVAGPGSFSQYMVSELAARHRKVVLGGQGGDEVFGGYTRYLIAYFEQCIKAAIDGTMNNGNFVVTYQSIIPNLVALKNYRPLLQEFWRDGLFEPMDSRYFRLINRAPHLEDEIRWELLGDYSPFKTFQDQFHGKNVGKESYFDQMTHFDFKTLLPALLQVEDRVSMAHGLESRVPLLDHAVVEFAATIPADVKFKEGEMKHVFKRAFYNTVPRVVAERTDKMGFPTPLTEWIRGDAREFVFDVFSTDAARSRALIDNSAVLRRTEESSKFGRNMWAMLSLELWQSEFHDRGSAFRDLLKPAGLPSDATEQPVTSDL